MGPQVTSPRRTSPVETISCRERWSLKYLDPKSYRTFKDQEYFIMACACSTGIPGYGQSAMFFKCLNSCVKWPILLAFRAIRGCRFCQKKAEASPALCYCGSKWLCRWVGGAALHRRSSTLPPFEKDWHVVRRQWSRGKSTTNQWMSSSKLNA